MRQNQDDLNLQEEDAHMSHVRRLKEKGCKKKARESPRKTW